MVGVSIGSAGSKGQGSPRRSAGPASRRRSCRARTTSALRPRRTGRSRRRAFAGAWTDMADLEARGITKRFGGVVALDDVSFDADAARVHALLGENGAGKSTFIKVLTGAVAADAGELRLFGQ